MPSATDEHLWTTIDAEKGGFFDVVNSTERAQTVLHTVEPGRVAGGPNTHEDSDQVAYVVDGTAAVRLWADGPDEPPLEDDCPAGTLIHIPAGTQHWIKSVGDEELVLLSVYAPPEYR
jgi:mannose-6-phosphate isomerase-like protein (cupin superfamily)